MVDVENEISTLQMANPSITAAQLDAGFNSFYQDLLSNPAVAGLAVRPHWDTPNPNPPNGVAFSEIERMRDRCRSVAKEIYVRH